MNAGSIFTRTRLGIDTRVWIFLTVIFLVSGALLGFRIATTKACTDISVTLFNSDAPDVTVYHANDRIVFTAKANSGNDVAWEFGDNGVAQGKRVVHSYAKPGMYYVTITVNGKCREFVSVNVRPQDIQNVATPASGEAVINGPDAPKAGDPVNFYTNVNGQTYEWNVLNSPNYETQRIAVATYIFTTEGPKTIELKVDGKIIRKDIQVLPSDKKVPDQLPTAQPLPTQPQEALPEPSAGNKPKMIPPEEFTDMLIKVTKGDMNGSSFDQYLCDGGSGALRVLLNDKDFSTLSAFCDKIKSNKKYIVRNTKVVRDDNTGCVKQLNITYCKKGFIGLFGCK